MKLKSSIHNFFTKDEIQHIKNVISSNCSFDDKVINRLIDMFSDFFMEDENNFFELVANVYKDKENP